jgi:hypothetical protein
MSAPTNRTRRFKLNLIHATDLYLPDDVEVNEGEAIAFSGVGHVTVVQPKRNSRGREIEYLAVEAIEIRLSPSWRRGPVGARRGFDGERVARGLFVP